MMFDLLFKKDSISFSMNSIKWNVNLFIFTLLVNFLTNKIL
jgi:hypothetical protein